MSNIEYNKSIPVRYEIDVLVAGGGPAGFCAAVASSRQGAKVLLIESGICLGGMGTAAGVSMLCAMNDGVNMTADGIGREIYERLEKNGGLSPVNDPNDHTVYLATEALKLTYDQIIQESSVEVLFATSLVDVETENGSVVHAICNAKSGMFAVKAKAFVDGTGDGDLCYMAGAEYKKGDEKGNMQPGSLVSFWSNIDWDKAYAASNGIWKQTGRLKEAIEDGIFTVKDYAMPGIIPTTKVSGNGNIGHLFGIDPTDEKTVTSAVFWGRQMVYEYQEYFKKYLTGYENMELVTTATTVGIRESRRITCDYELNQKDYWDRAIFDDEIGRFSYGIDLHGLNPEGSSAENSFMDSWLKKGESYGVPYRILTPKGLENVLVAGRCVSCDRAIQGSIRVMPGCYITGQAAGIAAAMIAKDNLTTRTIDVKELQNKLKKTGGFLPNI
jgi:ribulose 1,5-bisphosphate synthetase/thiazole synthase